MYFLYRKSKAEGETRRILQNDRATQAKNSDLSRENNRLESKNRFLAEINGEFDKENDDLQER